jgi:molybdopterin synthase catalytic subunit
VAAEVAAMPGVVAVAGLHRLGELVVGDTTVVLAVSAGHRGAAFDACRAYIDALKQRVPVWKEQVFADGTSEWVEHA